MSGNFYFDNSICISKVRNVTKIARGMPFILIYNYSCIIFHLERSCVTIFIAQVNKIHKWIQTEQKRQWN